MQDGSAGVRLEQKRRGGHVDMYFNGKDKLIVVRRTYEFFYIVVLNVFTCGARDLVESSVLTTAPLTILDHKTNQFLRFVQSIYIR